MLIKFDTFAGENRAIHPSRLPTGAGTISLNHKPGRGDLRPWRVPEIVANVPLNHKSIYRMGRAEASDTHYWLSWPTVVHAAVGVSANDSTERTYYTGDGAPKFTDNTMALGAPPLPTQYRDLGVPAPSGVVVPALLTQGTETYTDEIRAYVFTYVTDKGEEGPPSQPATIQVKAGATVRLTGFGDLPQGNFVITAIRVYKSFSSAANVNFFYVGEMESSAVQFDDVNVRQGEPLGTTDWGMPPDNAKMLTPIWGGMMAVIAGNAVRISEPYAPYAWPIAYEHMFSDATPVALGSFEQTLVVLTNNRPFVASGSTPDSFDIRAVDMQQSCVSYRSAVSMGSGVVWASPDGLCYVGSGGAKLLTEQCMTRDDWQAINPSSIVASQYQGRYVASYTVGGVRKGFIFDLANPAGIYFTDFGFESFYYDTVSDALYTLQDGNIGKWDAGIATTQVTARSGKFNAGKPVSFTCAQVIADQYPVELTVASDDSTYTTAVHSRDPVRLPANNVGVNWTIQIESSGPVQVAAIASSFAELANL